MEMDANTRNWIIGGVILIAVLVAAWWLFTKPAGIGSTANPAATSSLADAGSTTATGTSGTAGTVGSAARGTVTTTLQNESVRADDQPAGDAVVIAKMNLTRSTWIAVRDGKSIMGARRFEPGVTTGTVNLLRNTAAGQQYTVLMYVDDGDKAFDMHKDMLVVNATGAPVGDTFSALNGD